MRLFRIIQIAALVVVLPIADALSDDAVSSLNKALLELPADSSVFEIPEGIYHIASTWTIPRDHITIRGAGMGKKVLIRGRASLDI